jgi:NAD-dependent histone deacetylase SIR2
MLLRLPETSPQRRVVTAPTNTIAMPTIHVEPGSDAYLQEIATAVFKSRKVVVITGAGISTNSGIPVSLDASQRPAAMPAL